jgi:hypothetical protein
VAAQAVQELPILEVVAGAQETLVAAMAVPVSSSLATQVLNAVLAVQ